MITSVGALISLLAALLLLVFAAMLGLEARLLIMRQAPITTYTRDAVRKWPGMAIAVAGLTLFVIGGLGAHFVWDAYCGF